MKGLQLKKNPEVKLFFDTYPNIVRNQMLALYELVLEIAAEIQEICNNEAWSK